MARAVWNELLYLAVSEYCERLCQNGRQSMFDSILAAITSLIISVISASGYLGVTILMAVESACVPLPSEVIMPFAGYLVSLGQFGLVGAATAGALGCNLGSTAAYVIAARGGRKAIERWGPYILIRPEEIARADRFFVDYGAAAVLVGRLLPVVRTFIALPAGLSRMPMVKFQIYTFIGSWPWCFGLAYAGYILGKHWNSDPTLRSVFHRLDGVVGIALVAAIIWFIWSRWREGKGARR